MRPKLKEKIRKAFFVLLTASLAMGITGSAVIADGTSVNQEIGETVEIGKTKAANAHISSVEMSGNVATVNYALGDGIDAELAVAVYDSQLQMYASGREHVSFDGTSAQVTIEGEIPDTFIASAFLLNTITHEPLCDQSTGFFHAVTPSVMPTGEPNPTPSQPAVGGTDGNIIWQLKDGVLDIFGRGDMPSYYYEESPWYFYRNEITKVIVEEGVTSIGDEAFNGCGNLMEITIPDGVTKIGGSAFHECRRLKSIKLPDTVTSIGESAFYRCSDLESINIPDSVTSIGESAFFWDNRLTGIDIPDGVTRIEKRTFYQCYYLEDITIPDSVTSIGEGAFYSCSALRSVIIPDSVTSIGGSAFYGCYNLNDVNIPKSLTSIGEKVFYGCDHLLSINIPNSVTSIGKRSFRECRALRYINIPESVVSIGENSFAECNELKKITFYGDFPDIAEDAFSGVDAAAYYPQNNPTWINMGNYGGNIEWIPFEVSEAQNISFIEDFNHTTAETDPPVENDDSFSMNENVESQTESSLFSDGDNPQPSLSDPANDTSSLSDDFISVEEVAGLEAYTQYIQSPTGSMAEFGKLVPGAAYIFVAAKSLSADDLLSPDNLLYITQLKADKSGFLSVKYIPRDLLPGETAVFGPSPEIEPTITPSPGESITDEKTKIIYRINNDNTATVIGYEGATADGLEIPDRFGDHEITEIGPNAFRGCGSIVGELRLPAGLKTIGDYAFYGCNGLIGNLTFPDGLTYIGLYAFTGCSGFTGDLIFPEDLTSIDVAAFEGCDGFTGDLILPKRLSYISSSIFEGCSGFTGSLTLPEELIAINSDAFEGCNGFTGKLLLPESLTYIGSGAFEDCSELTGDLIFPKGLTQIESWAFQGCSGFTGDLIIPEGLTSIAGSAFQDCSGFTGKLVLPEGLTEISPHAFNGCRRLTGELVLPEGLTYIGWSAFEDCKGLTGELILPKGITEIGSCAFENCAGFTGDLILPESLSTLENRAFNYCSGFTGKLIIPSGLQEIEYDAFAGTNFTYIVNESSIQVPLPSRHWYSLTSQSFLSDGYIGHETAVFAGKIKTNANEVNKNVKIGDKLQLTAEIEHLEDLDIKFTWSVFDNNSDIASIDENGLLSVLGSGHFYVFVTAYGDVTEYFEFWSEEPALTVTPTVTPTPSNTPEHTPSATPSVAPTDSPKPSTEPNQTPSASPSPTDSPSVTPDAGPTPTTTPVPTQKPAPTTEPGPTQVPTPTIEPEPTPTTQPEPTQSPTLTPGAVTSPDGITAAPSLGSTKVDLSWEPVPDVDGYVIYVKDEDDDEFKKLKTLHGSDATSFSKKMEELGGTYTFKLQTFKKGEDGSYVYEDLGDDITVRLYEFDRSRKPKAKANTKTGSKKVFLQWEKIPGADGYMIYKYNPAAKKYELLDRITDKDATSCDFASGLKNGETYSFKVKAYAVTADGEKEVDGKASAAIQVTTPPVKAKKPSAVSRAKNEVSVSWPVVKNADGYRVYRSTSKNGKYVEAKTVRGGNASAFTDKNLKSGKVYYYKIRAYSVNPDGKKVFGKISAAKKVRVK